MDYEMSTEFKSPKINAAGSIKPILLVGVVGEGKETKLLSLLNSKAGNENPFVVDIDLWDVSTGEVFDGMPESYFVNEVFTKIDSAAKEHGSVVALFRFADECTESVGNDFLQRIIARENDKVVYVLSCVKIPEFIENSPENKDHLQVVQFELPPKPPVLQIHEQEESPFHDHAYKAEFLAKYPQQIKDTKDAQMLNQLADLMKAIEGIEGGILGQEASDRGMDGFVIQSLCAFSRAFKGSENELADGIARSVIKEMAACPVVPKFIEVNPKQKQPPADTPSLG